MTRLCSFFLVLALALPATASDKKPDPAATKLLAEARAARAAWHNFPGFTADLTVNRDGKAHKGKVEVSAQGKVEVTLEDSALQASVRREIASLVGHRLPVEYTKPTQCAFSDEVADHPLGRAITVLDDELHSSYRIRDKQIIEVNRAMKDVRFTITVLDNLVTREKQFLPSAYVVNTWDLKTKALVNSVAHHHTWTRQGAFDLPVTLLTVRATAGQLESQALTFTNVRLHLSK